MSRRSITHNSLRRAKQAWDKGYRPTPAGAVIGPRGHEVRVLCSPFGLLYFNVWLNGRSLKVWVHALQIVNTEGLLAEPDQVDFVNGDRTCCASDNVKLCTVQRTEREKVLHLRGLARTVPEIVKETGIPLGRVLQLVRRGV